MLMVLLAIPVVVAAGVFAIGTSLPQAHEATLSAPFPVPPETLWKTVTDVAAYPTWRTGLKSVERLPDSPAGPSWVEVGERGDRLPLETVESAAPKKFVARIGPGQPFGGTWTYEIAPEGSGSRLTITERGEIYNPIFRFMARYVFGSTATMEGYFNALSRKLGA
jgi:hypothetical protein